MRHALWSSIGSLLLVFGPLTGGVAPRSTPAASLVDDARLIARITDILATSGDPPRVSDTAALRLTRLGRKALPILFGALETGRLPEREDETSSPELLAEQAETVLEGICGFERAVLRRHFEEHKDGTRAERAAMLRVLERVGNRHDLLIARRLATPTRALVEGEVLVQLTETIRRILQRDELAYPIVSGMILSARSHVGVALVEALVALPSEQSLETLSAMLGFEHDLDSALLRGVGEIGMQLPQSISESVRGNVREFLLDREIRLVRDAAISVGKLEDHLAVGLLVDLLESEDRVTRENAHWSLTSITGLRFAPEHSSWKWWFEKEELWFEQEAPRLFAALAQNDLGRIVGALNLLAPRRYRRDEIAREIEVLFEGTETELHLLGTTALGQLGSPTAIPVLVELLQDYDEDVRDSAWRALRSITAADLPKDAAVWRQAFLTSPTAEN